MGVDIGSFSGVDAYVSTPDPSMLDFSGQVVAGPVAVTDRNDHFIESGPEKRCDWYCDIHPYWTWAVGKNIHTGEDTSVSLTVGGSYEYKSINFSGTQWQAQFCDGIGCRGLVTADLGTSALSNVIAGGESATGTHFGSISVYDARELPSGSSSYTLFFCHYSIIQNGGSLYNCHNNTNGWTANS